MGPGESRVLPLQHQRGNEAKKKPGYAPESKRMNGEIPSTEENYVFFPGKSLERQKDTEKCIYLILDSCTKVRNSFMEFLTATLCHIKEVGPIGSQGAMDLTERQLS